MEVCIIVDVEGTRWGAPRPQKDSAQSAATPSASEVQHFLAGVVVTPEQVLKTGYWFEWPRLQLNEFFPLLNSSLHLVGDLRSLLVGKEAGTAKAEVARDMARDLLKDRCTFAFKPRGVVHHTTCQFPGREEVEQVIGAQRNGRGLTRPRGHVADALAAVAREQPVVEIAEPQMRQDDHKSHLHFAARAVWKPQGRLRRLVLRNAWGGHASLPIVGLDRRRPKLWRKLSIKSREKQIAETT
jgi:hypothetical protein